MVRIRKQVHNKLSCYIRVISMLNYTLKNEKKTHKKQKTLKKNKKQKNTKKNQKKK